VPPFVVAVLEDEAECACMCDMECVSTGKVSLASMCMCHFEPVEPVLCRLLSRLSVSKATELPCHVHVSCVRQSLRHTHTHTHTLIHTYTRSAETVMFISKI
jgi:hypothetical protein